MERNTLLKIITIRILFVIIIIITAGVTAGTVAGVTAMLTENITTIVTTTLVITLFVIITLYILKCRITFKKRLSAISDKSKEEIEREGKRLTKWYVISTLIFTAFLSLMLFRLRFKLITELAGGEVVKESTNSEFMLFKILITVALFVFLLLRTKKKNKDIETEKKQIVCR